MQTDTWNRDEMNPTGSGGATLSNSIALDPTGCDSCPPPPRRRLRRAHGRTAAISAFDDIFVVKYDGSTAAGQVSDGQLCCSGCLRGAAACCLLWRLPPVIAGQPGG